MDKVTKTIKLISHATFILYYINDIRTIIKNEKIS